MTLFAGGALEPFANWLFKQEWYVIAAGIAGLVVLFAGAAVVKAWWENRQFLREHERQQQQQKQEKPTS